MRSACPWLVLGLLVAGCSQPRPVGPAAPNEIGGPPTWARVRSIAQAPGPDGAVQTEERAAPSAQTMPAPEVRRGDTPVARPPEAAPRQPATDGGFTFRLQNGDQVGVDVWKEEDLSTTQRILPDGTIAPPLLGTVPAAGRTLNELRDDLAVRYRKYLKDPQVSVRVEGIHSDRVFVLGEVKDAQAVTMNGPTTALASIAEAGGFAEEYAEKSAVRLIRRGRDGQPRVYNVNAEAILAGRMKDPPMRRGDILFVPARGVTNWARTVGQALEPIAVGLGAAGTVAATTAVLLSID